MNPITRKEVFLAAAGGQDVETPTPVTREEAFLDAIVKGGGSSLPSTETASAGDVLSLDDNKEPQWATPSGSGGGVLVVTGTYDEQNNSITLDKTWQEIRDGGVAFINYQESENEIQTYVVIGTSHINFGGLDSYQVNAIAYGDDLYVMGFKAGSASGYPVYTYE